MLSWQSRPPRCISIRNTRSVQTMESCFPRTYDGRDTLSNGAGLGRKDLWTDARHSSRETCAVMFCLGETVGNATYTSTYTRAKPYLVYRHTRFAHTDLRRGRCFACGVSTNFTSRSSLLARLYRCRLSTSTASLDIYRNLSVPLITVLSILASTSSHCSPPRP